MAGKMYQRLYSLRMSLPNGQRSLRLRGLRYITFTIATCLLLPSLLASGVPSLAQRAKSKSKSRTYIIDRSQSQLLVLLKQEGLVSRRYPTHRILVTSFNGKVEIPRDETRMSVEIEADAKSL